MATNFTSSMGAYKRATGIIRRAGQEQMTVSAMESDLSMIVQSNYFPCQGYADSLTFHILDRSGITDSGSNRGQYRRITYAMESEDDSRLCRIEQTLGTDKIDTTILFRNVDSVRFSYAELSTDKQMVWDEGWPSGDSVTVPITVKLELITRSEHPNERGDRLIHVFYLPLGAGSYDAL